MGRETVISPNNELLLRKEKKEDKRKRKRNKLYIKHGSTWRNL